MGGRAGLIHGTPSADLLAPRADELTPACRELDEALADVRTAGMCLCQFCASALDLSRFDRLAMVAAT